MAEHLAVDVFGIFIICQINVHTPTEPSIWFRPSPNVAARWRRWPENILVANATSVAMIAVHKHSISITSTNRRKTSVSLRKDTRGHGRKLEQNWRIVFFYALIVTEKYMLGFCSFPEKSGLKHRVNCGKPLQVLSTCEVIRSQAPRMAGKVQRLYALHLSHKIRWWDSPRLLETIRLRVTRGLSVRIRPREPIKI